MKNLEEIKTQLAALTKQVEEIANNTVEEDGIYRFTQEEMVTFVKNFIEDFEARAAESIEDVVIDSDVVELSLNGTEIEVEIDNSRIQSEIVDSLALDFNEDDLLDSIYAYYKNAKKK